MYNFSHQFAGQVKVEVNHQFYTYLHFLFSDRLHIFFVCLKVIFFSKVITWGESLGHLQKFKPQISMSTQSWTTQCNVSQKGQNEILSRMRFDTNKQKIATYSNS